MEAAAVEDATQFSAAASTSDPMQIMTSLIRGKRTKRHRSASPPPLKLASNSAATSSTNSGGENQRSASSATTTTSYESSSTEEEEDMANCLILLAQGRRRHHVAPPERKRISISAVPGGEMSGSRRFSDIATTTNKAGFFVYECKTCNRSFPSFQALGGHRASHKKPRPTVAPGPLEDTKVITAPNPIPTANQIETNNTSAVVVAVAAAAAAEEEHRHQNSPPSQSPPAHSNKPAAGIKAAKVHECSICGAEFTSGQALGGHMRRHRATNAGNQAAAAVTAAAAGIVDTSAAVGNFEDDLKNQQRSNVLALDLNMPAPEDLDSHHHHHRGDQSKFQFATKQSPAAAMVFSAPALVGCHY